MVRGIDNDRGGTAQGKKVKRAQKNGLHATVQTPVSSGIRRKNKVIEQNVGARKKEAREHHIKVPEVANDDGVRTPRAAKTQGADDEGQPA